MRLSFLSLLRGHRTALPWLCLLLVACVGDFAEEPVDLWVLAPCEHAGEISALWSQGDVLFSDAPERSSFVWSGVACDEDDVAVSDIHLRVTVTGRSGIFEGFTLIAAECGVDISASAVLTQEYDPDEDAAMYDRVTASVLKSLCG